MLQGGKLTSPQQPDLVKLVKVGSEEKLWYRAPKKIHVALLRGSTADLDGNISFERETLFLDGLNQVSQLSLSIKQYIVLFWNQHGFNRLSKRAVNSCIVTGQKESF